jgi:hypothetical protein
MRVRIESNGLTKVQIRACIEEAVGEAAAVVDGENNRRTMGDPNAIIAILQGGTTVLTAIVAGLLAIANSRNGRRVTIEGKWGKVEVPADTPQQEVERYVASAKGDIERVIVEM